MPRLKQKEDCTYCIIGYCFENHSTWQIDREGVVFLLAREVRAGELFSTDLFFELWRRGLIYTQGREWEARQRHEKWHARHRKFRGH